MTYTEPRPGGYGPPPTGHRHASAPPPGERYEVAADYEMNPFPLPDPETIEGRWDLEGDLARLLQTTSPEESVHTTGPIGPVAPSPPPPPRMCGGAASAAGSASGCRRCRGCM
ncbi:hypothetical protein SANT12839_078590 [Streptomyces antimycoticus]|uniref:Uncharacterized protein n=1 Tax=Streptomyces antimycoticus TaxID=68175 RepID=A0A4D4KKT5_9ACTN|nr:hypothetical protein [Streptomyces antimycoticus]GDY46977.1 hypothetical protein SANT12839_078590 [Streptomyces antimycoticus]